ncbi:hypothetical protein Nepgr_010780 [Nepenthes gracilis]|uniref:F-box domain-containing protein n=1 Tax=Nepenthes gracilis TaxID=150966 RepID=A0AAD3XLN4_NEPGR|nr:hypothetical protein Nepgr_010780 [Nepenthes gracilis]
MSGPLERYQKLKLKDSLIVSYRYPIASRELSFILRFVYSEVPKALQALILEDTLTAFRLLPQMQTQSAVSAANVLIQSAEAALPKQKRVLAITEFKQAKVAHKRRSKACKEDTGLVQLPQDVLVHLFSFLDMQSLVSAGLVCRLWYAAATDNYLWQRHSAAYFCDLDSFVENKVCISGRSIKEDVGAVGSFDWKDAFRRKYTGYPSWKFNYNRGYCRYCNLIVWLNNLMCPNAHLGQISEYHMIKPVLSPNQVVAYILEDSLLMLDSSDSDSGSDGEFGYKLWAYRRR